MNEHKYMPTRIFILLFFLLASSVWADRDAKQGAVPTAWSDQVEKDMVTLVAKNEQARQVYSRVIKRLRRSGVPATYAWQVFSDPAIKVDPKIVKRFDKPAERLDYDAYRRIFVNDKRISGGVKFYNEHKDLIHQVSKQYGVDPYLILSFVGVETQYGLYASAYPVFNSLHTIIHNIPRRAKWAEDEMVASHKPWDYDSINAYLGEMAQNPEKLTNAPGNVLNALIILSQLSSLTGFGSKKRVQEALSPSEDETYASH